MSDDLGTAADDGASPAALDAAYKAALYQAYFATGLEQTRSVFTLASAGVGLALTLLFSDKAKGPDHWVPVWLLLSAGAFVVAATLCVWMFHANAQLVLRLARDESEQHEDAAVLRIHRSSLIAFAAGIVLLLFAGVAQVWL